MTRTIKASEIKPGMTIRWEARGFTHEGPVERVVGDCGGRATRVVNGTHGMSIWNDAEVTVLSEIAQPQPEEPTAFGARVVAGRERFLRCDCDSRPWRSVSEDGALGFFADWPLVCEAGPVTVIDADPYWTAHEDTPKTPTVPELIEEWPEDDTALRKHKWRDVDGRVWVSADGGWNPGNGWAIFGRPEFGPWTRATDA